MNDLDGAMTDHSRTLELDENYSDALRERGSLFAGSWELCPAPALTGKRHRLLETNDRLTTFRRILQYAKRRERAVSVTPPTNPGNHT